MSFTNHEPNHVPRRRIRGSNGADMDVREGRPRRGHEQILTRIKVTRTCTLEHVGSTIFTRSDHRRSSSNHHRLSLCSFLLQSRRHLLQLPLEEQSRSSLHRHSSFFSNQDTPVSARSSRSLRLQSRLNLHFLHLNRKSDLLLSSPVMNQAPISFLVFLSSHSRRRKPLKRRRKSLKISPEIAVATLARDPIRSFDPDPTHEQNPRPSFPSNQSVPRLHNEPELILV